MKKSVLFATLIGMGILILNKESAFANSDTVTVFGWGGNWAGQTTIPASATNVISVCAGDTHSVALRADGRVVIWGNDSDGQVTGNVYTDGQPHYTAVCMPPEMTNVVKIAARGSTTAAIRSDGTLVIWGYRSEFLLTNEPPDLKNLVDVAVGGSSWADVFVVVADASGRAVGWGNNDYGQCNFPQNIAKVVNVAAGTSHSVLLLGDGTVAAFGSNGSLEREVPRNLRHVVSVGAGSAYSVAFCADGSLVDWGTSSGWPRPSAFTNVLSFACGLNNFLALLEDGSVTSAGYSTGYGELTIPGGVTGVLGIGIGGQHSLAMLAPSMADSPSLMQIHNYPGFIVKGTPGARYRIEYTLDLGPGAVWSTLTNITVLEGEQRFTDWTAVGPQRFYRAVLP